MPTKNVSFKFTPTAGIAIPVQVKVVFKDSGVKVNERYFNVSSYDADQPIKIFQVENLPADDLNLSLEFYIQDQNGTWVSTIITPGQPVSSKSAVSFNGYQIGIK